MHKKTDTFFIISNFNTDPSKYLEYCHHYHIYDQSSDIEVRKKMESMSNVTFVENSGHSLTNYFRHIVENYENLPPTIMFLKSNIIGRHVSQAYFDRVYDNQFYTFLYEDRHQVDRANIAYQLYDGGYLEVNNSWYIDRKNSPYFINLNDLIKFLFVRPIIPKWMLFSPGACYILTKPQIIKYPKVFYENMQYLVSYKYFPSEAYMVERIFHLIFFANYQLNDWVLDLDKFKKNLATQSNGVDQSNGFFNRLKNIISSKFYK